MADDVRHGSGSGSTSSSNTTVVYGTTTTQSAEALCICYQPGPEKVEVEQVLGAEMAQRVVEFDMIVPTKKPEIEQVVDVYVKDVEVRCVDIVPNKVIIRGDLEVKVMYVANLPSQPVHAYEMKQVRFTRDIELLGAMPEMKANADVTVEFVDYEFCCNERRKVHVTIVLKFWARVVTTTMIDCYALSPIDQAGQWQVASSSDTESSVAASNFTTDKVSASSMTGPTHDYYMAGGMPVYPAPETTVVEGFTPENIVVSNMEPVAGTTSTTKGTGEVTGNNVNVRTGPGTNFPVIMQVSKGTMLIMKEQAFGWYKVMLPDGVNTGWIAGWFIDVED